MEYYPIHIALVSFSSLFLTLPASALHSRLAPNHLFDSHARIFFLIDRRIDNERQ